MPRYDYECSRCGTREERQRPIDERDKPVLCGNCWDVIWWMRRVPAAPGFKLVGAGFHQNDYRKLKGA